MRKFGIILFMVILCVGYFFYVRNRSIEPSSTIVAIQVDKKFEEIKTRLEAEYPSTPKEVMQVYNELMGYAYCDSMKDSYIEAYVKDLRLLYSKELLKANLEENQVYVIKAERSVDIEKPLVLIGSTIETVIKVQNDDTVDSQSVQVEVKHSTNKGDILRTYNLVNEDGKWKINSWQNEN